MMNLQKTRRSWNSWRIERKYRKELAAAKEEVQRCCWRCSTDKAGRNAEIVDLPEEMIHEEVHRSVNESPTCNVKVSTHDMYFQITGTTSRRSSQQYEAEGWHPHLTHRKRLRELEGFDATEEEIQKEIEQLAADYNMEAA